MLSTLDPTILTLVWAAGIFTGLVLSKALRTVKSNVQSRADAALQAEVLRLAQRCEQRVNALIANNAILREAQEEILRRCAPPGRPPTAPRLDVKSRSSQRS
ncbi:hypothetical protein PENSPDRAFT_645484 [Peniophora sp. CONT]|nr:hypothetical protein PENSPDRAFT_645484 [Peniophora sp. CONT]